AAREEKEKVAASMAAVREGLKNFNMFHVPYVGASYNSLMLIVLSPFDLKRQRCRLRFESLGYLFFTTTSREET
ncbi:hypothetical protein, partial [Vibrio cholerae]|uniref:hypothetical protein n=1 Tax=Vibrio cholerae TaxID=666 RepID=UPI001F2201A9